MVLGVRSKGIFLLVAVPLVFLGVLFSTLFLIEYRRDIARSQAQIKSEAQNIRDSLFIEISRGMAVLEGIAGNPVASRALAQMGQVPAGLDNDDYRRLSAWAPLKEVLDYSARGTSMDLIYAASPASSGLILGRDLQMAEGFDVRKRDYFLASQADPDKPVFSAPRISAEKSDVPVIVITAAKGIKDESGRFQGLIAFNYRLNRLIDIIKAEMEARKLTLSLYDTQSGEVLWHIFPDKEYFYDPEDPRGLTALLESLGQSGQGAESLAASLRAEKETSFVGRNAEGDVLIQAMAIPQTRWAITLEYPMSRIRAQVFSSIVPPLLGFFVVFLAIQVLIFLLMSRGILSPIVRLVASLKGLAAADADLTVSLPVGSRDEIGQLAESFNGFIGKLRRLMGEVKKAIEATDAVKSDVSSSTVQTSAAIEEISANLGSIGAQIEVLDANISQTVKAIEEITGTITTVDGQINRQSAMVEQSTAAITQMMASLSSVNTVAQNKRMTTTALSTVAGEGKTMIDETITTFKLVESHIDQVQDMAQTIDNIASQTNLLSMNAAIEAAHAGETGKGFAVVAEEIRKLADSAAQSAQSITQVLRDIISSVADTRAHMSRTSEAFDRISKEVGEAVGAFAEIEQAVVELNVGGQQILESSQSISEVTGNIKRGSGEIKSGTQVLLSSSSEIKKVSDRVSSGMAESTTGAREIVESMQHMVELSLDLSQIVDELKREFGQFKT